MVGTVPHGPGGRAQYYPAFLDLQGRRVVVVGGGDIATSKVHGLLPCGPEPLVVIAPEASPTIRERAVTGVLEWRERPYEVGDLNGAFLTIAATDDRALNARVAGDARGAGALVLAVDDPVNCDLIAPAVARRGDVTVAISTHGRSPAIARWLRLRLQEMLPEHWADLLDVAANARARLRASGARPTPKEWQSALDEQVEHFVAAGQLAKAEDLLIRRLAEKVAA